MNIMKHVPNEVRFKIGRQLLIAQKNSPKLLFGVGIVGIISTVVLASRATLKLEDIVDETQSKLEKANRLRAMANPRYSEQNYRNDTALIYARGIGSIAKLYAPSIIVGALSVTSLAGSHHILSTRNAGLMAAYATIEKGFAEYRQRVLNEVGPEKEREFRYGTEIVEVVDEETGKKHEVVKVGPNATSMYARWFDESYSSWRPEPSYNLFFLQCEQNYANDMLHFRGHIFLNEVYDRIGIKRTPEGQIVGWVRNSKNGDNNVDFGLFKENTKNFLDDDRHGAILLDFNVDGEVYNLI